MKILWPFSLSLALLSCGCKSSKQSISPPVILDNSDTIRTEYIETVRIDTVTVEVKLPAEAASVVRHDSTSHIETSLAASDAWINADGSLGHSISNKIKNIKADVAVQAKDTKTVNSSSSVKYVPTPVPVEKKVYIEADISAWQKFRLGAFWFLAAALALSLLYIFRKPLLRLMCRLKL